MSDQSLTQLYRYAERAYIRVQLHDVLIECFDASSLNPFYELVDNLVMAGPGNLDLLREVLDEVSTRRNQVLDDLNQVLAGLKTNLESYGIQLKAIQKPWMLTRVKPIKFLAMLRESGITEDAAQNTCLQMLKNSRDLVVSLNAHLKLLTEMVSYLEDWLWGMVYQTMKSPNRAKDHTKM